MKPFFNSRRPKHHKQKGNTAPLNQQVFSTNPSLANSMSMQPQLGLVNPQIPIPFNNSNTLLSNGHAMANMPPLIAQQPGILSGPNDLAILQLQNQVNKLNALKMLMDQVNQLQGELFGPSFPNLPQQLNQNMGLLQNPMQNMMNPVMPLQMPINSQVGSFNVPSSNHQVVGAQSQNFFVNPPFGAEQRVNPNQPNFVMPTTSAYGSKLLHVADQQVQGKLSASQQGQSFLMPTVGANGPNVANQQVEGNSPALQQSEKVPMPAIAANGAKPLPIATQQGQANSSASQQSWNSQPSTYNRWQGNTARNGQSITPKSKWEKSSGKNFKNNRNRGRSQSGHQKSDFNCMDNGKRKLEFSNEHGRKGNGNERVAKFGRTDLTDQATEEKSKPSRTFFYTEQEIKQWRESRRKHYPTKTNIEKKQVEVIDREANLRRKQLKEILAKQAELGVEVAEIPPDYLLDSEKLGVEVAEIPPPQVLNSEKLGVEVAEIPPRHLLDSEKQEHGREDNRRSLTKKGKFWNKHDKRGRFNKKGRSAKQVGSGNEERKPTLLEKLLSTDIKRDKRQLLQVFRFMVANSFFKDWPEKPLKFPSVVVKEDGYEDEIVEKKSSLVREEVSEDRNNTIAENFGDRDDNIEHDAQVELGNCFVRGKCDIVDEVDRVEEGEIVD
ncbi:hypothetical protein POTOM_029034 [Populus tomentosa]|uniref:FMR1-interacting protein 1 conserved domain-containing protein n=1 Tax=Populus tomentosa TaxID=118781 RepID=A0A8X8CSP1_POPTO|nr:hypothetical protein POTOM_029034 [Populus tomentosa]